MYLACPYGERRADIRAAHIAANQIASNSPKELTDDQFRELQTGLRTYLKCDADHEEEIDLEALKLMKTEG